MDTTTTTATATAVDDQLLMRDRPSSGFPLF
jgi:hypothetical protein